MSNGFLVNLRALDDAAAGVSGTIAIFARENVSAIPYDPAAIGDDDLAGCMSDFLSGSRWGAGVDNLVQDGQQISARLTAAASAYRKAEHNVRDAVNGIFQGTGNDPGTVAG